MSAPTKRLKDAFRLTLLSATAASALAVSGMTHAQSGAPQGAASQAPADTAPTTNTATCMATVTESKRRLFFTRTRSETALDQNCVAAQAAIAVMANLRDAEGKPSIEGQVLALAFYQEASPEIKAFMERYATQEGTSMEEMQRTVHAAQGGAKMVCTPTVVDGNKRTLVCKPSMP